MAVIEVVSDVVCPWCYIGKRRLEKALALLGLADAPVRWTAFQLNPDAPGMGMDRAEYRARKFGPAAAELELRAVAAGREDGLEFHFDRIARVPNTLDAHRLIRLAGDVGLQNVVVESLFHAYFVDGEDIGNPAVLLRIGADTGLSAPLVVDMLAGDAGAAEVREQEEEARAHGVTAVPSFLVDGRSIASGAQPPAVLASLLGPALGC